MASGLDQELRQLTLENMKYSRSRWKHRERVPQKNCGLFVWFMGTGGNPEATICQSPATAGFLLGVSNSLIYVDPGPGAPVKAAEAGLDPGLLDGIYISHGHVDHYAGVEALIEGMCWAMSTERGLLMAPQRVFDEGLVSKFHQGLGDKKYYKGGPKIVTLKSNDTITFEEGRVRIKPVPVYHGGENYGFILEAGGAKVGYTSDTNYITSFLTPEGVKEYGRWGPVMDLIKIDGFREDLKRVFSQVDILIANVTSHNALMHRHLTALGLAHLLAGSRVRLCLLTHFGYSCTKPRDIRDMMAEFIQAETGVQTIAARDQQKIKLDNFLT